MQKLYCYIDETGQDAASELFIVVAVVSDKEQNLLREQLLEIESLSKIGKRKWHKSRSDRRKEYLRLVLEKRAGKGEIYFNSYKKPLPYFLPMLETLEKAILDKAEKEYRTIVYVDGIDKKKAIELTNALRLRKIKLRLVKSRRDESEPLIRLADRWAGCIRAALSGRTEEQEILKQAKHQKYLQEI
jgi:hypothetical protein